MRKKAAKNVVKVEVKKDLATRAMKMKAAAKAAAAAPAKRSRGRPKSTFSFRLGDVVKIGGGSESGPVVARSEHCNSEPQYQIRYIAGDGRCVEAWWSQSALRA